MKKSKTERALRAAMDPIDHERQLAHHQGWVETGRALWAAADLIWPRAESGFRIMNEHFAAIERARRSGGNMAARLIVMEQPTLDLTDLLGYCNTYLLNAGYAVENFLKAVRIKRLSLVQRKVEFGSGSDRIPATHTGYVEMARVELGSLTADEVSLLRRLALFVRWVGRYPMPKQPPPIDEVNGVERNPQDKAEVDALCQRLIDKYESLN